MVFPESEESVWGGSAEDQRSDQLHLPDDREEVHRPNPIRPEGRGETLFFFFSGGLWCHWWGQNGIDNVFKLIWNRMKLLDVRWMLNLEEFDCGDALTLWIRSFLNYCCVILVQALASAIASTQVMKAQQVVKGENGDEVSLSLLLCLSVEGNLNPAALWKVIPQFQVLTVCQRSEKEILESLLIIYNTHCNAAVSRCYDGSCEDVLYYDSCVLSF